MRFEPGEERTVALIPIVGDKIIKGGNGLASGKKKNENLVGKDISFLFFILGEMDLEKAKPLLQKAIDEQGYRHKEEKPGGRGEKRKGRVKKREPGLCRVPRKKYARIFGPTTGFILFCFVLFCFVLFCFVLFCFVLFDLVWFGFLF